MNSQFIIDWFILSNFCIFTKDRHQRCDRANAQKNKLCTFILHGSGSKITPLNSSLAIYSATPKSDTVLS